MKRLFFLFVVACLFFSCDINNWPETVVKNNSDFPVTFTMSRTGIEYDLPIRGSSVSFESVKYDIVSDSKYTNEKRVIPVRGKDVFEYTFEPRESFEVRVINDLEVAATLKADGWMDDANITAATGEQIDSAWLVYTKSPRFSVVPDNEYKAIAVYNTITENEKPVFLVTLQWSPNP